ncbi:hypothetical protein QWJ34_20950 [Saccharibacillus sp. CPCC 101409]|uniref:hypothetical protein n=1 Tax=Saccharibacillus sp. CPCC 101409 TaxID=3058041 RepID=UPI0026713062|nr:hypothetical protein [Saccharibacillus sp. CPCC 101409]MDO3412245.1 hypothetical protein [Saccharibacillus sp. CPCC 101409]
MNKRVLPAVCALLVALLLSACGENHKSETGFSEQENTAEESADSVQPPTKPDSETMPGDAEDEAAGGEPEDTEILIVIDQTEMPIESGGFNFSVKRRPEGYALQTMQWKGDGEPIVSTFQEAAEKGATGGDGFYISGDGQFSGFLYPNSRKGERGEVSFVFVNDEGEELSWKKKITLQ